MNKTTSIVMRFLTLGGATVAVTRTSTEQRDANLDHAWQCLGCDAGNDYGSKTAARTDANRHAGWCRSMPKDDAP